MTLLRASALTVNELATRLELTDNGVRAHLTTLERDGLIRRRGIRRGFRKPEQVYELTDAAGQFFPKAHELLLSELIQLLKERDEEEARDTLETVGRRLACPYTAGLEKADTATRTSAALRALSDMGGVAEVKSTETSSAIRGASCPLASLTAEHPEVCLLAQALLSEILGVPVREKCERDDRPRCCFEFDNRAA